MTEEKKDKIPIKAGLWKSPVRPGDKAILLGSQCIACNEFFFPRKENKICTNCQSEKLVDVELSGEGKIFSYTVIMQKPPNFYKGEVPYAEGFVELQEGIRVETLFTGCDFEKLHVGMQVEAVIEKLYEDDEGHEIITYKFRPTKA